MTRHEMFACASKYTGWNGVVKKFIDKTGKSSKEKRRVKVRLKEIEPRERERPKEGFFSEN